MPRARHTSLADYFQAEVRVERCLILDKDGFKRYLFTLDWPSLYSLIEDIVMLCVGGVVYDSYDALIELRNDITVTTYAGSVSMSLENALQAHLVLDALHKILSKKPLFAEYAALLGIMCEL